MRQVFRKIPVYTGDVSGVCSALFELGGMIVMHDPSGCNSTYNTHDEIRWYDHDSLIFLSGLNEMDAIMGSDEALIRDIIDTARIYSPAFIAIVNSPIPYIIGMDFDAICRIVEEETGIPAFYIPTNGMHDYVHGAGLAFLRLAERFAGTRADQRPSGGTEQIGPDAIRCNLLGLTPLDFAAPTAVKSLRRKAAEAGMEIVSCWAMEESLDAIRDSSRADVSLVLSSTGLEAARYLKKRFGIPFVAGFPAAGTEAAYFSAVREAVREKADRFPFRDRLPFRDRPRAAGSSEEAETGREEQTDLQHVCLIGEPVTMTSLAASVEKETGAATHVFCATESGELFLGEADRAVRGEEALYRALQEMTGEAQPAGRTVRVIADPCYKDILPSGCELEPLPHLAFSGRIYLKEIPDLFQIAAAEL